MPIPKTNFALTTDLLLKTDLASKYGVPIERLNQYEQAGLLMLGQSDGRVDNSTQVRVAVIAKAEGFGFTFEEIKTLLEHWGSR